MTVSMAVTTSAMSVTVVAFFISVRIFMATSWLVRMTITTSAHSIPACTCTVCIARHRMGLEYA
jgi:hypothetical protein